MVHKIFYKKQQNLTSSYKVFLALHWCNVRLGSRTGI